MDLPSKQSKHLWRNTPYAGGFLLTSETLEQVVHYSPRQLTDGWTFWRDASKTESYKTDHEDNFVLVYGHWADTSDVDIAQDTIADRLLVSLSSSLETFERHLGLIAGRYVVIVRHERKVLVYNDAMGVRSVYYSLTTSSISSHMNLLLKYEKHRETLSWEASAMSMDFTMYEGVRQLLPNFRLDASERQVKRFFPREKNRFTSWDEEQILSRVELLWERELKYYSLSHPKTIISVTGGLDSRLMLAMARNHTSNYESFTYGAREAGSTKWSASMNEDYNIVQKLLPTLQLRNHAFLEFSELPASPPELISLAKKNSIGNHGRFLLQGLRDTFEGDGWLHIRGTGGEIVRRQLRGGTTFKSLLNAFTAKDAPDLEQRAIALGYDSTLNGYNPRDLAYWEIRMGKWHAETINEEDVVYDTLVPMSVREIFELLLAFPEEERKIALPIRELINRNYPILNFIGTNDRRNLYEQMRDERLETMRSSHFLSTCISTHEGEIKKLVLADPAQIYIPREFFAPGIVVTGHIFEAREPGSLAFTLHQTFTSSIETEYFKWQVLVDGKAYLECNCSLSKLPTHITVSGLATGQRVSIGLVPTRDVKNRESWERASRTTFKPLEFIPQGGAPLPNVEVKSDSKFATPCL